MKYIVILFALLGGCQQIQDPQMPDQCMRRDIFKECMAALPAGPAATKYNDWDEVVGACESAAYYQSIRRESQVTKECRP